MAFWLLPQDQLLAMLDGESFKRMYIDSNLRNDTVASRYNHTKYDKASISINDVMNNFDKIKDENTYDFAKLVVENQNVSKEFIDKWRKREKR